MSKNYDVLQAISSSLWGVREQIKMAQKLHCPHMERKYKQALLRLQTRFLKPDHQEVYGKLVLNHYNL